MAMFNNMLTIKWDTVKVDSTQLGWQGNPNIFDPWDTEATNTLNAQSSSLMGGKTDASNHDTHAIMKMTITPPPVGDDSIDHLRRLKIVALVCLPSGHAFLV